MAGDLGKDKSISVADLRQDRSMKGSVQPSIGKNSRIGKDKKYYDKKKAEFIKLEAENENLKENNWHLKGQADVLKLQLEERGKENTSLVAHQAIQNKSIEELQQKLIALDEHHKIEMNNLKMKHAREMNALKAECAPVMLGRNRDMNEIMMNDFMERDGIAPDNYLLEHVDFSDQNA